MAISNQDLIEGRKKLGYYKQKWELLEDGDAFSTNSSLLQPVLHMEYPAMLKIPIEQEERWGILLMDWWNGDGAARVLKYDNNAILMERAVGGASLVEMVKNGQDDEASRIICSVAAKLHAPRDQHPPELIPLSVWFKDLEPAAKQYGGVLCECARVANQLLNDPQDIVVLHGDIHHENILDSGTRGWFAIDPKRLAGERGFDFANIFCNPDIKIAASPGRLPKQVKIVAAEANLDPKRLLQWIIAWAGLSAAWFLKDGENAEPGLLIAKIAAGELKKYEHF